MLSINLGGLIHGFTLSGEYMAIRFATAGFIKFNAATSVIT